MNKILKLTLVLFLICAIVAGVLGVVNELTYQQIAQNTAEKTARSYGSVLASDSYEEVPFNKTEEFSTVDKVSKAGDSGYVVELTVSGAQGLITMAVGVDNDLKCTGISIISHSETSGLGANAASTSEVGQTFRAQFVGEDANIALVKNGGNIDALAGATITSRAVTAATATAIRLVSTLG